MKRPWRDKQHTTPWVTVVVIFVLCTTAVIVVLSDKASVNTGDLLLAVIIANIPGLISAVYAERASKDVRRIEHEIEGNDNGR